MGRPVFQQSTAGTIRHRPKQGPPSSGNVTLFTPGKASLQAQTAATVATATAIAQFAEAGSRTLQVDSASAISAGEWWYVGDVGSDRLELMRVRKKAGSVLTFTDVFEFDHDLDEAVSASELTYTLTTTHTATLDRNYRVVWDYVVNSATYYHTDTFDVVLHPFCLAVTPADLPGRIPSALLRSAPSLFDQRDLIDTAEQEIRDAIEEVGRVPDRVRSPSQFTRLGIYGVMRLLLDRQAALDASAFVRLEQTETRWHTEWSRIQTSGLYWYDDDEDDSVGSDSDDDDDEEGLTDEEGSQLSQRLVIG